MMLFEIYDSDITVFIFAENIESACKMWAKRFDSESVYCHADKSTVYIHTNTNVFTKHYTIHDIKEGVVCEISM